MKEKEKPALAGLKSEENGYACVPVTLPSGSMVVVARSEPGGADDEVPRVAVSVPVAPSQTMPYRTPSISFVRFSVLNPFV